jgi:hypothetical protein
LQDEELKVCIIGLYSSPETEFLKKNHTMELLLPTGKTQLLLALPTGKTQLLLAPVHYNIMPRNACRTFASRT